MVVQKLAPLTPIQDNTKVYLSFRVPHRIGKGLSYNCFAVQIFLHPTQLPSCVDPKTVPINFQNTNLSLRFWYSGNRITSLPGVDPWTDATGLIQLSSNLEIQLLELENYGIYTYICHVYSFTTTF